MPATPSAVGRRYSALVVLAVVQLMLVVLTPSKPPKTAASTALAAGPAAPTVEGQQPGTTETTAAGTVATGSNTAPAAGTAQGATAAKTSGAGGQVPTGGSGATAAGTAKAATATAAGPEDRSHCAPNGQQVGPVFYMPTCQPVFKGDNGGSTMNGVTGDKINFLIYRAQANAQVNAI